MPANEVRDFVAAFTNGFQAGDAMAGRAQERKRKREDDANDLSVARAKQEHAINRDTAAADARAVKQREDTRYHTGMLGATNARNTETARNNKVRATDADRRTTAYEAGVKGRNDYYAKKGDPNAGLNDYLAKEVPGFNGVPFPTYDGGPDESADDEGPDDPAPEEDETPGYAQGGMVSRPAIGPATSGPIMAPQAQPRAGNMGGNGGWRGHNGGPAAPRMVMRTPTRTIRRFATGGIVEEEVPQPTSDLQPMPAPAPTQAVPTNQTTIGKQAPETAPPVTPPGKLGGSYEDAIKAGLFGLAEKRQMEHGQRGAVPATNSSRQATAPKEPLSFTKAEYDSILKKIDPEGKLPEHLKDQMVLQKGYEYFTKIGDAKKAKEWATNAVRHSQMVASLYGRASVDAAKEGDFEKATKLLVEGYNNHVPDGQVMDVKLAGNAGMVIFRDAKTGEVYGDAQFTPQNVMAMAAGLSSGQAFYKAMLDAASGPPKGTGQGKTGKAPVDPEVPTTMKSDDARVRKDVIAQLDGAKGEDGLLNAVLAKASGALPNEGETDKDVVASQYKPLVRTAARDIAADLAIYSKGSVSPEMAAQRVAEMLSIDSEDPTRVPFDARIAINSRNKKPKRIDVRMLDGEVMRLPYSSLPRLQAIIKFQQARGASVAAERKAAADEETAKAAKSAKSDKESSAAYDEIKAGASGVLDTVGKGASELLDSANKGASGLLDKAGMGTSRLFGRGAIPTLDDAAKSTADLLRPRQ